MAPARAKKAKYSIESGSSTRPQSPEINTTPQRSPQRPIAKISAAQKQALIDNLQLEVTERARKLRAQYALQARSLRTRIELRVNRIPTALRTTTMGELQAKFREARQEKPAVDPHSTQVGEGTEPDARSPQARAHGAKPTARGRKRNSDALEADEGYKVKIHEDQVPNPKKRAKVTDKAGSHHTGDSNDNVLSPKSANSRTLPQSPVKSTLGSPQKRVGAHATSPLKLLNVPGKSNTVIATAALAGMVREKTKPGRPKAAPRKQGASRAAKATFERDEKNEGLRTVSSTSNSSAMSTGTTIVKPIRKVAITSTKKDEKPKGAAKRVGGTEVAAPGRRVLRKRG